MLLSHKHQFLFVHIAKTGGTSVRSALSPLRWKDPMYYLQWPAHKISGLAGHTLGMKFPRHSRIVAAKEMLPETFFKRLYKFAFVRNPWDLQVSSFHHIKRERPEIMNGYESFGDFLKWKFDSERPYQYHIETSLQSQCDYLVDLHGDVLVDFIGRYESLQEDFQQVCEHIGVKAISLPHKRKAKERKSYQCYYTDETAALVANHFAQDITMFGYTFD